MALTNDTKCYRYAMGYRVHYWAIWAHVIQLAIQLRVIDWPPTPRPGHGLSIYYELLVRYGLLVYYELSVCYGLSVCYVAVGTPWAIGMLWAIGVLWGCWHTMGYWYAIGTL